MARYVDCPVCGAPESVRVSWQRGDYAEITGVDCGCELSPDQAEAIEVAATQEGPGPEQEP